MTRQEHIEWLKQTLNECKEWKNQNDECIKMYNDWIKLWRNLGMDEDVKWAEGMRRREYRSRAKNRKRIAYWKAVLQERMERYGMCE